MAKIAKREKFYMLCFYNFHALFPIGIVTVKETYTGKERRLLVHELKKAFSGEPFFHFLTRS